MAEHERDRPDEERICFRIGISLGDVVHEDGDIFGEGVNLAARLEQLAEPGGVCVARSVYEEARYRLPVRSCRWDSRGSRTSPSQSRSGAGCPVGPWHAAGPVGGAGRSLCLPPW